MWSILENILDSLIMCSENNNGDILKTVDFVFNNFEINRYIPNDFTSTLCLLISNLYLHNNESTTDQICNEDIFNCYISVINYSYVIYNNIWSSYERRVAKNQFGWNEEESWLLDFNKSELQSLVRVVAMICKDKHENTGLKCLRVIVTSFCDE